MEGTRKHQDDGELGVLVRSLRCQVRSRTWNDQSVRTATAQLSRLDYNYDRELFPQLPAEIDKSSPIADSPTTLSEALLWKMGKWQIYKNFVANYEIKGPLTTSTDVVFAAFARHLGNRQLPIYDQHALRAMWAINPRLSSHDAAICRAALFKSKGKAAGAWKAQLSGRETISCYNLYVSVIAGLATATNELEALDRLLMPLGQALKTVAKNYDEFAILCGFTTGG